MAGGGISGILLILSDSGHEEKIKSGHVVLVDKECKKCYHDREGSFRINTFPSLLFSSIVLLLSNSISFTFATSQVVFFILFLFPYPLFHNPLRVHRHFRGHSTVTGIFVDMNSCRYLLNIMLILIILSIIFIVTILFFPPLVLICYTLSKMLTAIKLKGSSLISSERYIESPVVFYIYFISHLGMYL